jgi:hypothetical protein
MFLPYVRCRVSNSCLRRPTCGNRLKFRRLGKTDKRFHGLGEPTNFRIEADSPGNVEVTVPFRPAQSSWQSGPDDAARKRQL